MELLPTSAQQFYTRGLLIQTDVESNRFLWNVDTFSRLHGITSQKTKTLILFVPLWCQKQLRPNLRPPQDIFLAFSNPACLMYRADTCPACTTWQMEFTCSNVTAVALSCGEMVSGKRFFQILVTDYWSCYQSNIYTSTRHATPLNKTTAEHILL